MRRLMGKIEIGGRVIRMLDARKDDTPFDHVLRLTLSIRMADSEATLNELRAQLGKVVPISLIPKGYSDPQKIRLQLRGFDPFYKKTRVRVVSYWGA